MRGSDIVLFGLACLLIGLGPLMALQEWSAEQDERAAFQLTGEEAPPDHRHRDMWRLPIGGLAVMTSALSFLAVARVARSARVRRVTVRQSALLMLGVVVLLSAFVIDLAWGATATHGVRVTGILWLYMVAGLLMAGSVRRLAAIEAAFQEPLSTRPLK